MFKVSKTNSTVLRHIIAALHFNKNLQRKVKTNAHETEQVRIVYPKYKNGEAIVRNVRVQPNFSKLLCPVLYKL